MGFETPESSRGPEAEPQVLQNMAEQNDGQFNKDIEQQNLEVEATVLENALDVRDKQELIVMEYKDTIGSLSGTAAVAESFGCDKNMIKLARLAGVNVHSSGRNLVLQSAIEGTQNPDIVLSPNSLAKVRMQVIQEGGRRMLSIRPFGKDSTVQEMKVPMLERPQPVMDRITDALSKFLSGKNVVFKERGLNPATNELHLSLELRTIGTLDFTVRPGFDEVKQCIVPMVTLTNHTDPTFPKSLDAFLAEAKNDLLVLQEKKRI